MSLMIILSKQQMKQTAMTTQALTLMFVNTSSVNGTLFKMPLVMKKAGASELVIPALLQKKNKSQKAKYIPLSPMQRFLPPAKIRD